MVVLAACIVVSKRKVHVQRPAGSSYPPVLPSRPEFLYLHTLERTPHQPKTRNAHPTQHCYSHIIQRNRRLGLIATKRHVRAKAARKSKIVTNIAGHPSSFRSAAAPFLKALNLFGSGASPGVHQFRRHLVAYLNSVLRGRPP